MDKWQDDVELISQKCHCEEDENFPAASINDLIDLLDQEEDDADSDDFDDSLFEDNNDTNKSVGQEDILQSLQYVIKNIETRAKAHLHEKYPLDYLNLGSVCTGGADGQSAFNENKLVEKDAIELNNWYISLTSQLSIIVNGSKLNGGEFWKTTSIKERVGNSPTKLRTISGSIYHLRNSIDVKGMKLGNFPDSLIESFRYGFPKDWQLIVKSYAAKFGYCREPSLQKSLSINKMISSSRKGESFVKLENSKIAKRKMEERQDKTNMISRDQHAVPSKKCKIECELVSDILLSFPETTIKTKFQNPFKSEPKESSMDLMHKPGRMKTEVASSETENGGNLSSCVKIENSKEFIRPYELRKYRDIKSEEEIVYDLRNRDTKSKAGQDGDRNIELKNAGKAMIKRKRENKLQVKSARCLRSQMKIKTEGTDEFRLETETDESPKREITRPFFKSFQKRQIKVNDSRGSKNDACKIEFNFRETNATPRNLALRRIMSSKNTVTSDRSYARGKPTYSVNREADKDVFVRNRGSCEDAVAPRIPVIERRTLRGSGVSPEMLYHRRLSGAASRSTNVESSFRRAKTNDICVTTRSSATRRKMSSGSSLSPVESPSRSRASEPSTRLSKDSSVQRGEKHEVTVTPKNSVTQRKISSASDISPELPPDRIRSSSRKCDPQEDFITRTTEPGLVFITPQKPVIRRKKTVKISRPLLDSQSNAIIHSKASSEVAVYPNENFVQREYKPIKEEHSHREMHVQRNEVYADPVFPSEGSRGREIHQRRITDSARKWTQIRKNIKRRKDSNEEWSCIEMENLRFALSYFRPDRPNYWEKIADFVGTRTPGCCQMKFEETRNPRRKAVKFTQKIKKEVPAPKERKIEPGARFKDVVTARRGTLRRKKQMREFLEAQDQDYEDDIYDATPYRNRTKSIKLPIDPRKFNVVIDSDDFSVEEKDHSSSVESPRYSSFGSDSPSPDIQRYDDRDDPDAGIFKLHKLRKKMPLTVPKKQANQARDMESDFLQNPSCILQNDHYEYEDESSEKDDYFEDDSESE